MAAGRELEFFDRPGHSEALGTGEGVVRRGGSYDIIPSEVIYCVSAVIDDINVVSVSSLHFVSASPSVEKIIVRIADQIIIESVPDSPDRSPEELQILDIVRQHIIHFRSNAVRPGIRADALYDDVAGVFDILEIVSIASCQIIIALPSI